MQGMTSREETRRARACSSGPGLPISGTCTARRGSGKQSEWCDGVVPASPTSPEPTSFALTYGRQAVLCLARQAG